jgi:predicted phosphodiesterase
VKIGFLTDVHYRGAVPGTSRIARRDCRRAGELLDRSLAALLDRGVDLVICAGDCVDTPDDPRAIDDLAFLDERFRACGLPAIVVPGNHDPVPEVFYRAVAPPPRRLRLGDCEFLTFFDDLWQPAIDRARRGPDQLALMRELLGVAPPAVRLTFVVQHYVVYPPHTGPGYDHTYENAEAIRQILEGSPRRLVVLSGHYHAGHPLTEHAGGARFTGRALCERPYPSYVLDTDGIAEAWPVPQAHTLEPE